MPQFEWRASANELRRQQIAQSRQVVRGEIEQRMRANLVQAASRAIAPSCHNPKQLGAKFVDRLRQHALGLDARLAGRVEPQQVHHDVANDGEIVESVAGANA